MFKFIEGLPPRILAIEITGKITHEDYRDHLIPEAEGMMGAGPIKALCVVRSGLADFSPAAMWDDQAFGFKHWSDVSHMALATDHAWIKAAVAVFAPLSPTRIRVFPLAELAAATAWVIAA